jgi:ABC-type iron transport system FetAB permease component
MLSLTYRINAISNTCDNSKDNIILLSYFLSILISMITVIISFVVTYVMIFCPIENINIHGIVHNNLIIILPLSKNYLVYL